MSGPFSGLESVPERAMPAAWAAAGALRGAQDTLQFLVRTAQAQGWAVYHLMGSSYFRASKRIGESTVQISAAVIEGKIQASRVLVTGAPDVSDQVVGWLEAKEA